MAEYNKPLAVPTSSPFDSWEAYKGYETPGNDPLYASYVAVRPIPPAGPQRYQAATPVYAPTHSDLNPDYRNYQAAPQPFESPYENVAKGAPAIPWADSRYIEYQIIPRTGPSSYMELIGAYAPRTTSATDVYL